MIADKQILVSVSRLFVLQSTVWIVQIGRVISAILYVGGNFELSTQNEQLILFKLNGQESGPVAEFFTVPAIPTVTAGIVSHLIIIV